MAYSDELFKRRKAARSPQDPTGSVPAPVSPGPRPSPASGWGAGHGDLPDHQADHGHVPLEPYHGNRDNSGRGSGSHWSGWVFTGMACAILILLALLLRSQLPNPLNPVTPLDPDADGLTVLVVYESDPNESDASYDQRVAMASVTVREWLNENCGKIDGYPAWRFVDDETDVSKDDPIWGRLLKKPRDSLPWLYMTGGGREVSEAMVDGGVDDFLKQLEKGK